MKCDNCTLIDWEANPHFLTLTGRLSTFPQLGSRGESIPAARALSRAAEGHSVVRPANWSSTSNCRPRAAEQVSVLTIDTSKPDGGANKAPDLQGLSVEAAVASRSRGLGARASVSRAWSPGGGPPALRRTGRRPGQRRRAGPASGAHASFVDLPRISPCFSGVINARRSH